MNWLRKTILGGIEGYVAEARKLEQSFSDPGKKQKIRATSELVVALDKIVGELPDDVDVPLFVASAMGGALVTIFDHYLEPGSVAGAMRDFIETLTRRALPIAVTNDNEQTGVGEPRQ